MNREIKFRAWGKEEKHMRDSIIDLHLDGNICAITMINKMGDNKLYHIEDIELMQYTGLKDCKGRDIYEGDIAYHNRLKEMVVILYDIETASFVWSWLENDIYKNRPIISFHLEIFGNIYENPELLEAKCLNQACLVKVN